MEHNVIPPTREVGCKPSPGLSRYRPTIGMPYAMVYSQGAISAAEHQQLENYLLASALARFL